LTEGRRDESGDFTEGAGLTEEQDGRLRAFLTTRFRGTSPEAEALANERNEVSPFPEYPGEHLFPEEESSFGFWLNAVQGSATGQQAVEDLRAMAALCRASGYGPGRIMFDASVVRGLEYYTGPVFEIELTFPVTNEKGETVVFGAVGGGGRYDGLVSRFRREPVPATGFSIGVSRLATALRLTGNLDAAEEIGPVVVLVLDRDQTPRYQQIVSRLRHAGIRAEMFLGATKNFGKQVQYADRRNSPAVIIEGSEERSRGIVQIKDLVAGKQAAAAIKDNAEWKAERPGQFECKDAEIVAKISELPAVKAWLGRRGAK
jgi:histidyl-tRNA synthetase